jgi:enamine deaminase RidA (YjgF/YER057c/UK114 family)
MTISNPSVATLAPAVGYSHITVATGTRLVFCAGQGALDAQGSMVGIHDLVAQTAQAIKNLALALEAANATLADVVKTTVYVVGLDDDSLPHIFAGISAASKEIGQPFPLVAGTLLGVQRLAVADALIEIEAIAVLP